jgi:16S rRNA processing protein RimM
VRPAARDRVCVGRIGAAHGVRGEVWLQSFTADPLAILHYGPLESEDGARVFEIEAARPARDALVARLKGIADRTAAERLRNTDLYVARARLPAPEPDEFYHADLIGLTAAHPDGAVIGTVVAVHNFGAGDLIEIRPTQGSSTALVPFTAATVPQVDIAGGRIVIAAAEEWFAPAKPEG